MSAIGLPVRRKTGGVAPGAFTAAGGLVVLALLVAFIATNAGASLAQRSLRARWDRIVAAGSMPAPRAGDPVAELAIPSIGLDAIVVEGPGSGRSAPTHIATTALPGGSGLSSIEAGRLGFGGFFARLDRLTTGDTIAVRTPSGVVTYEINDARVIDASSIDLSSGGDTATLVLIAPASHLGGGARIVVRAREKAAP